MEKESEMNKIKKGWVLLVIFFLLLGFSAFIQPSTCADNSGKPSILVDTSTGRITVTASREELKEIERMIPQFPLQIRQVEIEARILNLSEDVGKTFGLNLERLTDVEVPIGTEGEGTALEYGPRTLKEIEGGVGSFMFSFYRLISGEEKLDAIINMLIKEGKAEVLSSPRVTTMSGEVAGIYAVQDVPYLAEVTITSEGDRIEVWNYATVGVVLQVLPKIIGDDLVQMSIVPIVGDYEYTTEGGSARPLFKRQISPTNVTVKEGETVIIGGLIKKEKTKIETRFPVLSYLPVIGNLFKNKQEKESKSNLLITVRPHIVSEREIKGRDKKIFTFEYALAGDMAKQISDIISVRGMIELNPKEAPPNSILVRDNEDRVKVIQEVLNGIGSFVEQRRQRLFSLQFSSAQPTKEILESLISGKGSIKIEEENSLRVEDGAYQLSQIVKAIFSLEESNKIRQRKTFSLEYVQAGSIVSSLEELLSPQGSIEIVDNSLIVKDNNWVIEQMRKRVEELDISGNSS
ncbi:hypothetical protein CEE34_11065 [Candidatus Aerophobetes bacterium Ae_b3a]|nr:MAG: hypothetical protein CEE34_11065 [Candidatus Aerophobetes bacterium Ae_b3a]